MSAPSIMIESSLNQLLVEPPGGLDERFCEVMDAAPVMIWVSGQDKCCVWFNRKWLIFTGRSMAQELGNGWTEGVHREDFDRCLEIYLSHFDARKEFRMQYRLRQRDGAYHWIDDIGIPRYAREGQFLGYIASCVDIHEHRDTQDELRRRLLEIAHLNRSTTGGELLATIAHEIYQPLTAIATNGNAGLRWLSKEPPNLDEVRAALERMVDSVHRAKNVVETIRSMFKKGGQNNVPLNVNKLIQEMMGLLTGELQERHVSVQTNLLTELPEVTADRVQLQQVILNLIMNAAEAMDPVVDRRRLLKVTSKTRDPAWVLIAIEDFGTGVDQENIESIFEPFYTTKALGMGMGLSICRSIVEAHGGRLFASHNQPHGMILQIVLPANEAVPER
jgi:PAS domain S-box-containing protein